MLLKAYHECKGVNMPRRHSPRHGSMQYWPRVRAKRQLARVRSWTKTSKDPILGFIGYKAGMTHIMAIDTRKTSTSKGEEIAIPVTIIECPPLRIAGVRLYKKKYLKTQPFKDILFKLDKPLSRLLKLPKKAHDLQAYDNIEDITLLVYTQPVLTGIKKKPELMELALNGTLEEKIKYIKEHVDKEILITSAFKEGDFFDAHSVTKATRDQ